VVVDPARKVLAGWLETAARTFAACGQAQPERGGIVAEPIEQAPARVRAAAAAHASGRDRQRAEARDEIAKWKRGEPSRVMTVEELLAELHSLDDADEDR
jgi:hypothetical protein